ncbi:MAG: hypothetical protein PGN13_05010 [Patulibacter minatonensis]
MSSRLNLPSIPRSARGVVAGVAAAATLAAAGFAVPAGARTSADDICAGHRTAGAKCQPGKGRKTAGGNGKASHAGWPAITGILWMVNTGTTGRSDSGTDKNDELLGSHGGDTLSGGKGNDVLWGDQSPTGNNEWQHDTLSGGEGKDWIYSSHGKNTIEGGPGDDHIFVHFGKGTVNCGPGYDSVKKTLKKKYTFKNCEHFFR